MHPTRSGEGVSRLDHFDVARDERQAARVIGRLRGIRALTQPRHIANGRHRSDVVVVAFVRPSGNGRVVKCTAQRQIRPNGIPQGVEGRALTAPLGRVIRVVHGPVQQDEPMPGWRLTFWAICPEFGQNPGVVSTQDRVGCIGRSGDRVLGMPWSNVTAIHPIVKGVHVGEGRGSGHPEVAHRGGADVPHRRVFLVEVAAPQRDECKAPRMSIGRSTHQVAFLEQRGGTTIQIDRPSVAIPFVILSDAVAQGKRCHLSPLGPLEIRGLTEHIPTLVHKHRNGQGLPGVGVDQGVIARRRQFQIGIDGLVHQVGVVGSFVGPVRQAESDHPVR